MVRFLWLVPVVLAVGCGVNLSSDLAAPATGGARQVFECSDEFVESQGYELRSLDKRGRRLVARRVDESVHRSAPTFLRAVDQLTVEVGDDAGGGTLVQVTARTYHIHTGRRGPTEQERRVSGFAVASARALLEECAGGDISESDD